ncbi:MAG TPA: lysophospholipid acyltransferase family protein [Pyrinomonadaceae bacterium]|nr:lysophospholipid acyltransferase family protein [Pyrinomonadaceae bacterium]
MRKQMEESAAIEKTTVDESSTTKSPSFIRRLHYWWSLFWAGTLLGTLGPPILIVSWLVSKHELVYPWATFGARWWLRLSGTRVKLRGLELLDPKKTYVFVSNHRSYLDTAAIFVYLGRDLGRRIGLLAKKELLKVPVLGVGMGFVNVMAIDRTNRESAIRTTEAAAQRIKSGVSFAVFVEGTRAKPGELLPFKKGAFYMARQAGVPVVPVAIKNSDVLMGKGTGEARSGTLEMVILPPVETADRTTDEAINELISEVRQSIAKQLY